MEENEPSAVQPPDEALADEEGEEPTPTIALLEVGVKKDKARVTTQDLMRDDLDEFGCRYLEGYSWCPYSMSCVQDWEGGDSGPCNPPATRLLPPDMPPTAFVFHDECREPGVISGKLSILPAYNDHRNDRISDYVVYFCADEGGRLQDVVGLDPLLEIPKGDGVLTAFLPETAIPDGATHLAVFSRNKGLDMPYGITRKLEPQLNIYGNLGSYHTQGCAVWRRGGPSYFDMQGFTFSPTANFNRGRNMTMRVYGKLRCSDMGGDSTGTHVGRGNATVEWVIFHSADGSNTNARILPRSEHSNSELARGTFRLHNGACVGHSDGVPVEAFVRRFQGGHLAVWMKLTWHGPANGEDYALVCDGLTYEIAQGVKVVSADYEAESGEFYCGNSCPDPSNDPFIVLEYHPRSSFSGTCDSDEGRACTNE